LPKNTKELLVTQLDPAKWKTTPSGFHIYTLWQQPETGATISLFKCPKGVGVPVEHRHASNQFMYCLEGEYEYVSTGLVLKPGTFYMNPKGHPHGPTMAREDSLLIEMYDGPHYFERPVYHTEGTVGPLAGRDAGGPAPAAKRGGRVPTKAKRVSRRSSAGAKRPSAKGTRR